MHRCKNDHTAAIVIITIYGSCVWRTGNHVENGMRLSAPQLSQSVQPGLSPSPSLPHSISSAPLPSLLFLTPSSPPSSLHSLPLLISLASLSFPPYCISRSLPLPHSLLPSLLHSPCFSPFTASFNLFNFSPLPSFWYPRSFPIPHFLLPSH